MEVKGFTMTNPLQTKTIFIGASSLQKLKEKGLRRLKLGPAENYDLVYLVDGKEMSIESFENVPPDSVLKFKTKDKSMTQKSSSSSGEDDENMKKLLERLQQNMDIMLSVSDNDLTNLSNLKSSKFQETFKTEFLQSVKMLANQTLLIRQEQKAIAGIKGATNQSERLHEFPTSPQQLINADLLDSLPNQKYLFASGEKGMFAIKIEKKELYFKSPAFGVTYKTTDEGEKRKFQIEIIETEPNVQCKAIIDDQNKLKIVDGGSKYEYELYGIVYNHKESITDLRSNAAVERFIKNLEEILPSISYPSTDPLKEGEKVNEVKGFTMTNQLQTKTIHIGASSLKKLKEKGLRRLKLDPAEDYDLVFLVDGKEKPVESFENLPPDSALKFKKKDQSTSQKSIPCINENEENVMKLLKQLQQNMDSMLLVSNNDLTDLSSINLSKFEEAFNIEFLQRVTMLANQTLLIRQEQKAIKGIKDVKNQFERLHEFPATSPQQLIIVKQWRCYKALRHWKPGVVWLPMAMPMSTLSTCLVLGGTGWPFAPLFISLDLN